MAVRPRGQVVERRSKSGRTYAIRFYAYGRRRYLTLGREFEGWTRRRAEDELANVLADVRRDLWVEPLPGARRRHRKQRREMLFASFADGLLAERRAQLSEPPVATWSGALATCARSSPTGSFATSMRRPLTPIAPRRSRAPRHCGKRSSAVGHGEMRPAGSCDRFRNPRSTRRSTCSNGCSRRRRNMAG